MRSSELCTLDYDRYVLYSYFFFFQAEDGIRDGRVTGVQTCALPISPAAARDAQSGQRRRGRDRHAGWRRGRSEERRVGKEGGGGWGAGGVRGEGGTRGWGGVYEETDEIVGVKEWPCEVYCDCLHVVY